MAFKLGLKSKMKMIGVHPDLVKVVNLAITLSDVDFTVVEGVRLIARQKELFAKGATTTMRSRHIYGFAVDLAPVVAGQVRWDWPLFTPIEKAMKTAAQKLGVPIEWGGDWTSFKDGPHWQLPHRKYPDPK